MFKNKNVLVAGGTGLVGIQLIKILNKLGANVYVASLDKNLFKKNEIKKFFKLDLKNIDNCLKITKKIDIVFNLLGVTGSPQTNIQRPATFMMSNLYYMLLKKTKLRDICIQVHMEYIATPL